MARPSTPLLSRDRIVDGAMALLDSGSPFTIPGLGKALGVHPSSLYNHFANRDAIVEAMRSRVVEGNSPASVVGLPWDEMFIVLARALRAGFANHPNIVPLLVGQQVSNEQAIEIYETLSDALSDGGFSDQDVLAIIGVFDNFTTGAGLDAGAPLEVWVFSPRESALSRSLAKPELAEERAVLAFELGLELIVDGLRRRLNPAV
jgi:AcrR family transcriptional regulator